MDYLTMSVYLLAGYGLISLLWHILELISLYRSGKSESRKYFP